MEEHPLGRHYIAARTDTTQQSGQTPDKEVEIKKTLGLIHTASRAEPILFVENKPTL
jgi:hypothetical protein